MTDEPHTQFMQPSVERELTRWYADFTEKWTVSIAVDNDSADSVEYSLRVAGPNGEVCRNTAIEPESTPPEIRAKFEEMLRDGAEVV